MTGDKDENRKDKLIFLIFLWKDNCFTEFFVFWASLLAQIVRHLPAMWETWVRSLGQGRCPGEGNGNPLQYSCLENSTDG